MNIRSIRPSLATAALVVALPLVSLPAAASGGLAVAQPDALWPQWRARIAVQTATLSPVSLSGQPISGLTGSAAPRGLQGGAVLGDYTFARPSFGAFRASGGLWIGAVGGALGLNAGGGTAGSHLDLAVNNVGTNAVSPGGGDVAGTVPYLGLGFTGSAWHGVAITADVGMVAERPSNASGMGRAVFGNQGMDSALRDMRLSPVLQLGVRYTF